MTEKTETKLSLNAKLLAIQTELKAPKGQYNSFGKYKYRSAEDILEAVKPLLAKYKALLILTDTINVVGEEIASDNKTLRTYLTATAKFIDTESDDIIVVSASAREPQTKTGMDASQITGTASSYARKYALNGLFCIDDTKDADTDEYHNQTTPAKPVVKKSVEEYSKLIGDCKTELGINTLFYEWSKVYTKGTPEYSELTKKSFDKKKQITGA